MTSRERLLAVLMGKMPDRAPISTYELVGYDTTNFCNKEPSYKSLMDYIREKTDCVCMWDMASDEKLFASAHDAGIIEKRIELLDGVETRASVSIAGRRLTSLNRRFHSVYTTWRTERWCKDLRDVNALLSLPYEPVIYDARDYARIEGEVGERGVIMSSLSDPAYMVMDAMEFGDSLVYVMSEPEHFARAVNKLHGRAMQNLERSLNTRAVDLYRICGPEYLTPPYLPPECFERYVLPYVREMVELIHQKGAIARLHCHGKIGRLMDMIASTGADALDPCEAPPDGDAPIDVIKTHLGDRMTLFGNLQLKLLEKGTPDQVREETLKVMATAKEGGRFVIMPTAAPIDAELKQRTAENYRAFIDAALEAGAY
jgi:uroporphyrinogen-III decarboxylase